MGILTLEWVWSTLSDELAAGLKCDVVVNDT
jgi:hypothetical protein